MMRDATAGNAPAGVFRELVFDLVFYNVRVTRAFIGV